MSQQSHSPEQDQEHERAPATQPGDPRETRHPHIRWASKTHVGRFRKINQDAYLMFACNKQDLAIFPNEGEYDLGQSDVILAVSDGMGGEKLGHRASKLALSRLGDTIPRHLQNLGENTSVDHGDILSEVVYDAHQAINHEARFYEECEGMGATLTICWFTKNSVHVAHVGDSRLYLYAGSRLRQISHDHTLVGNMQRRGDITEMQARRHPNRHRLSQAIGAGVKGITPQILSTQHAPGDLFVLCSDGLTDGLWDKNIARWLKEYQDLPERELTTIRDDLLKHSLEEGGRDNITLILAEILG